MTPDAAASGSGTTGALHGEGRQAPVQPPTSPVVDRADITGLVGGAVTGGGSPDTAPPDPYYSDEWVTLYHGDCLDVLPALPSGAVRLVFTSPPYNLGNSTGGSFPRGKVFGRWSGGALAGGYLSHRDNMPWPDYIAWQQAVLSECWRVTDDTGAIFYNHKPRVQAGVMLSPLSWVPDECNVRQIIIWTRGGGVNAAPTHYMSTHEWIVLLAKTGFRLRSQGASSVGDVWRCPPQPNTLHPAPFPISLPLRALETTDAPSLLDPFAGSGTALVAAKQLGRKAIGIEIEERYCEQAAQRLAQDALDFGGAA